MKNIICFGLAIGLMIAMALPIMAQTNEAVHPDTTDTTTGNEVIISPEGDATAGDEDIIISPNPDGTIGVDAETESTDSNRWPTYGIWWAVGIIIVVGGGLLLTRRS